MNSRSRNPSRTVLVLLWVFGMLVAGCGQLAPTAAPSSAPESPAAGSSYWPTSGWRTSPPEAQGIDPEKLTLLLQAVQQERLNLHSLLIIRNGYIVSETYFQPYTAQTPHQLYSVTKSVVATLVGIAIDKGSIDGVDQPLADFFPDEEFEGADVSKGAMTLEDLLTMRTGLDWQEQDSTFQAMYQSRDWVQFMFDLPLYEQPGRQFRYCSGCSHLLSAIIQQRTGITTRDFAQQALFDPLGMDAATWEQDRQGIPIGGWGLRLTPRDMAKLGYLYLHNGTWDGQQIVWAAWVKAAVQSHTETDSELGLGYGYQWWTEFGFGRLRCAGARWTDDLCGSRSPVGHRDNSRNRRT